jgi:hypothetical protein
MLTQITNNLIADKAVGLNSLNADPAQANSKTLLSGAFAWLYQDSHYFDFGSINVGVDNVIQLLLQTSNVDFGTDLQPSTVLYDAGTIV